MIDPLLFYFVTNIVIVIGLLSFIGYLMYQHTNERRELIYAIKARDLQELKSSEIMVKTPEKEPVQPEFMPVEQVSDEDYFELINKAHGQQ